jgi:predicted outer membrane repeat protein
MMMAPSVPVFGGFAGTEAARAERNWAQHRTILDGQGTSNCVVRGASGAVLDGFVVTNGHASGESDSNGAGLINERAVRGMVIANCYFLGNRAARNGGAIWHRAGSLAVWNCVFSGCRAAENGGAICVDSVSLVMTNCTLTGNSAVNGGGVYLGETYRSPSVRVTNCILWGNAGGGIAGYRPHVDFGTS